MKLKIKEIFIAVLAIFFIQNIAFTQTSELNCGFIPSNSNMSVVDPTYGIDKPTRSDLSGGDSASSTSYFPVLVVFVQFKDETTYAKNWTMNSAPTYLDSMIAPSKISSGNFWEYYNPNTQILSSQWAELSKGKLHVISPSGAFSVVLPHTALEYWTLASGNRYYAEIMINNDIWQSIRNQGLTDWRMYDRWSKQGDYFYFNPLGQSDGYVDFVYKIHKSKGSITYQGHDTTVLKNNDGYNALSSTHIPDETVDPVNNIKINYWVGSLGSGLTVSYPGMKENYINTVGHEHMHYTVMTSGHITYSRCNRALGIDNFMSPYDMILNNYQNPTNASFGTTNYLGDYSSRNAGIGDILKVPINGQEFFLLSNRGNISKWDSPMLGDSAILYGQPNEYSKGLYIYHIQNGIYQPWDDISPQDMECADGYYEWEYVGLGKRNIVKDCWESDYVWRYYKHKNVLYTNDGSILWNNNPYGDELSFSHQYGDKIWCAWFGYGKTPIDACHYGTDKIYTTDEDVYDKESMLGDRYDAWKPGYNEVFSPYSSPNTFSWSNDTTGIFIYYDSLNGNTANIKIYRATEFGGETDLADILEATPPSRPMGLNVSISECDNDKVYPVLTWNHNMEPDMIQGEKLEDKRYKIFRAYNQYGTVPEDYFEVADLLINKDEQPVYLDMNAWNPCWEGNYLQNSIRYKIVAIDNTDWSSVYSDFVSFSSEDLIRGDNMGNFVNNNTVKKYELLQNYPNPFNPVTKINYALPKDGFVTLKIYDITGREIQTLVNEVKQAGYYAVDFNGSHLSSGVYFYRIKSGNFVSVKRMVLVK